MGTGVGNAFIGRATIFARPALRWQEETARRRWTSHGKLWNVGAPGALIEPSGTQDSERRTVAHVARYRIIDREFASHKKRKQPRITGAALRPGFNY